MSCPFFEGSYENDIYFCNSVEPQNLGTLSYEEVRKSICESRFAECELFRRTFKPHMEKAGFKENNKCPNYVSSKQTKSFHGEIDKIEVSCKLPLTSTYKDSRRYSSISFGKSKGIPCLTNCHDCSDLFRKWWLESGNCEFIEEITEDFVYKSVDRYDRSVNARHVKLKCKYEGKVILDSTYDIGFERCATYKYKCYSFQKAMAKKLGFPDKCYLKAEYYC